MPPTAGGGLNQSQGAAGGGSALLQSPFDPSASFATQQQQMQSGANSQQQQQQQQQQQNQLQQQQQLFLQSLMAAGGGNPAGNNPFGVSLPGGYAMPGASGGQGFYPASSSSGNGNDPPIAPSPADSTSAFFAFTPATGPVDSNPQSREGTEGPPGPFADGGGESALGPMVGNKHRAGRTGSVSGNGNGANGSGAGNGNQEGQSGGNGLQRVDESFSLPPPAQRR